MHLLWLGAMHFPKWQFHRYTLFKYVQPIEAIWEKWRAGGEPLYFPLERLLIWFFKRMIRKYIHIMRHYHQNIANAYQDGAYLINGI